MKEKNMFRCTDCGKEYETNPGYCDCGNDQFEEIAFQQNEQFENDYSDSEYDDEDFYVPAPKLSYTKNIGQKVPEKKKELSNSDKVGIAVFSVCIFLSILVFVFVGSGNKKPHNPNGGKTVLKKDYSIPVSIDSIWDSRVAYAPPSAEKVDPSKILNTKLQSLDGEMNSYLMNLAEAMIAGWDRSGITGNGITQLEFRIENDGSIVGKKIFKYSGNKTLDNSVGMLSSSFSRFQTPPSSYKKEIIILSFSSNNGVQKAYYPNVKKK